MWVRAACTCRVYAHHPRLPEVLAPRLLEHVPSLITGDVPRTFFLKGHLSASELGGDVDVELELCRLARHWVFPLSEV